MIMTMKAIFNVGSGLEFSGYHSELEGFDSDSSESDSDRRHEGIAILQNEGWTERIGLRQVNDINDADSHYDAVYDNYMDQLDSLYYAMDNFTVQAPVGVQRTDTNTTLSTISQTINLPTMDLEPVDSAHSKHQHPEQHIFR